MQAPETELPLKRSPACEPNLARPARNNEYMNRSLTSEYPRLVAVKTGPKECREKFIIRLTSAPDLIAYYLNPHNPIGRMLFETEKMSLAVEKHSHEVIRIMTDLMVYQVDPLEAVLSIRQHLSFDHLGIQPEVNYPNWSQKAPPLRPVPLSPTHKTYISYVWSVGPDLVLKSTHYTRVATFLFRLSLKSYGVSYFFPINNTNIAMTIAYDFIEKWNQYVQTLPVSEGILDEERRNLANVADKISRTCETTNQYLDEIAPAALGAISRFDASISAAIPLIDKLSNSLESSTRMCESIKAATDSVKTSFSTLSTSTNTPLTNVLEYTSLLVDWYYAASAYGIKMPILKVVSLLWRTVRTFGIDNVSTVYDFISEYWNNCTPSSEGLTSDMMEVLIALAGVVTLGVVPKKSDTKYIAESMRYFNTLMPFARNLTQFMSKFLEILPDCCDKWAQRCFPEYYATVQLKTTYARCIDDMDELLLQDIDTIFYNKDLTEKLETTYIQVVALTKIMAPIMDKHRGEFSLLREKLRRFEKHYDSFKALRRSSNFRICPHSITICGDSQIGKSTLSSLIARFLFPQYPPERVKYSVPADPDLHWNGYSPLYPCTIEDDADQDAEYKNALMFFAIVTNNPFQPPMASLDDASVGVKGTPYGSKLHIRCTNTAYPRPTAKITSLEAYWRRRHLLIYAYVDPSYYNNDKSIRYDPNFKHLRFARMNPHVETAERVEIGNLVDLLAFIKRSYDSHMKNEERLLSILNANTNDVLGTILAEYDVSPLYTTAPVSQSGEVPAGPLDIEDFEPLKFLDRLPDNISPTPLLTPPFECPYKTFTKLPPTEPHPCDKHCFQLKLCDKHYRKCVPLCTPCVHKCGAPDVECECEYVHPSDIPEYQREWWPHHWRRFDCPSCHKLQPPCPLHSVIKYISQGSITDSLTPKPPSLMKRIVHFLDELSTNKRVVWTALAIGALRAAWAMVRMRTDPLDFNISEHSFSMYERAHKEECDAYERRHAHRVYEGMVSGDAATARVAKQKTKIVCEGSDDPSSENLYQTVFKSKQVFVRARAVGSPRFKEMCGLFIGGRYCLLPYHLFIDENADMIKEKAQLSFTNLDGEYEEFFDPARLTILKGLDACVYEFGPRVRLYKDIRHHFISKDQLDLVYDRAVINMNKYNRAEYERVFTTARGITQPQVYQLSGTQDSLVTLIKGFEYSANTGPGDCGSILTVNDTRVIGKIIGIHIAGYRDRSIGLGILITQETLADFTPRLQPPDRDFEMDYERTPRIALADGNYTYFGPVDKTEAIIPRGKTEIEPSLIHDFITPHTTKPVSLAPSAVVESIERFFHQSKPFNPDHLQEVVDDQKKIFDTLQGPPRVVVSEHVAINGDPNYEHMESLDMHTSPGLPYKLKSKSKGKFAWFDGEPTNYSVKPDSELRRRIDERIRLAKLGKQFSSRWMDIPKDERRKPTKKTRTITVPPLDFSITFRMYFLSFIAAFLKSRNKTYSAIGMDPYGGEWTETINEMLRNSTIGGDADYKFFDSTGNVECLRGILDAVNYFYRDEEDHEVCSLIREVLFEEIINTPTQFMDIFYMLRGGLPSGANATSVFGTILNSMYQKLAWLGLAPTALRSCAHYANHVKDKMFGDDLWKSISQNVIPWYNLKTIANFLKNYAITLTMADKTGEMIETKPVLECSFLKNSIRKDGLRYHALLEEDTLYEMVNWVRTSSDPFFATETNINCSLRFWYHYGKERFEHERNRLLAAIKPIEIAHARSMNIQPFSYFHDCYTEGIAPKVFVSQGSELTPGELDTANTTETTNAVSAITFVEQKPTVTIDSTVPPARNDSIMFGEWDSKRILGKPIKLGTYAFATSNTLGTILKTYNIPNVVVQVGGSWLSIFNAFTFFKARTRIRVQLNGNRFSAGRLILYAVPFNHSAYNSAPNLAYVPFTAATGVTNLSSITTLPHVFLDASSNDVVELVLPFVAPYEWFNLATNASTNPGGLGLPYRHTAAGSYNSQAIWTVSLAVFNPLSVGTGAPTSIYASVWLSFDDVELCVPRIGVASSQGGTQSSVVNNINNWDSVANMTLPNNVTGDKFDIKSDVGLGMDKPNNTLNPIYVVRRAIGYMTHARNIENSNRLALVPSGTDTATPSDFGTEDDEMSLPYLCGRYTFWYTFTMSTTQTFGTPLATIPITPYVMTRPNLYGPSVTELSQNQWDGSGGGAVGRPPLLGYVSMPFNFWGGSIDYRFDFVTNSFVTAKIFACILYGTNAPELTIPSGIEPTTGLGYTFEVNSDNKTFEINVPYVADTPWKKVMRSQFLNNNTSGINQAWQDAVAHECCTGTLVLYVLNPLVPPAGLPNTYPVNVFVRGGKDFRLNYISRANTGWYAVSQGSDDAPTTEVATLGQNMRSTHLNAMSDSYVSLRDVLKRFTFAGTATINVPAAYNPTNLGQQGYWSTFIPIVSFFSPANSTNPMALSNPTSTPFAWFASLYRFCRGSLRFKVLYDVPGAPVSDQIPTFSLDFCPENANVNGRQYAAGSSDVSTGPVTINPGNTNSAINTSHFGPRDIANDTAPFNEVEVPHVYPNRIRPVPYLVDNTVLVDRTAAVSDPILTAITEYNNYGSLVINCPITPNAYTVIAKIYIAIGDDFRFGRLLAQPSITYGGITSLAAPTAVFATPPDFYA
jgi:hypothetical protein